MIKEIIIIVLLSFLPFLEARAGIPYGILVGLPWWIVLGVTIIANIAVAPIGYFFWKVIIHWFRKIKLVDNFYHKTIERVQRKSGKYVDKYGTMGLALFIGVPLPGSGVYTAALASIIFGMKFKKFIIASIIGVVIASVIVTVIVMSGIGAFGFLVKQF